MMAPQQGQMLSVCGLWSNQTKDGREYMSGSIGNVKVLIFRNQNKKGERSPDWNLCLAPKPRDGEQGGGAGPDMSDDMPF